MTDCAEIKVRVGLGARAQLVTVCTREGETTAELVERLAREHGHNVQCSQCQTVSTGAEGCEHNQWALKLLGEPTQRTSTAQQQSERDFLDGREYVTDAVSLYLDDSTLARSAQAPVFHGETLRLQLVYRPHEAEIEIDHSLPDLKDRRFHRVWLDCNSSATDCVTELVDLIGVKRIIRIGNKTVRVHHVIQALTMESQDNWHTISAPTKVLHYVKNMGQQGDPFRLRLTVSPSWLASAGDAVARYFGVENAAFAPDLVTESVLRPTSGLEWRPTSLLGGMWPASSTATATMSSVLGLSHKGKQAGKDVEKSYTLNAESSSKSEAEGAPSTATSPTSARTRLSSLFTDWYAAEDPAPSALQEYRVSPSAPIASSDAARFATFTNGKGSMWMSGKMSEGMLDDEALERELNTMMDDLGVNAAARKGIKAMTDQQKRKLISSKQISSTPSVEPVRQTKTGLASSGEPGRMFGDLKRLSLAVVGWPTTGASDSAEHAQDTPAFYLTQIQSKKITRRSLAKHLIALRVRLTTSKISWLELFINSGGINCLSSLLVDAMNRMNNNLASDDEEAYVVEAVKCLRALMNTQVGMEKTLQHESIAASLLQSLKLSSVKLRMHTMEALAVLCLNSTSGHELVSQSMGEDTVSALAGLFSSTISDGAESEIDIGQWELLTTTLSFINALVNAPDALETRAQLRLRFESILEHVSELCSLGPPEQLLRQVDIFEEEKREDEQELNRQTPRKELRSAETTALSSRWQHLVDELESVRAKLSHAEDEAKSKDKEIEFLQRALESLKSRVSVTAPAHLPNTERRDVVTSGKKTKDSIEESIESPQTAADPSAMVSPPPPPPPPPPPCPPVLFHPSPLKAKQPACCGPSNTAAEGFVLPIDLEADTNSAREGKLVDSPTTSWDTIAPNSAAASCVVPTIPPPPPPPLPAPRSRLGGPLPPAAPPAKAIYGQKQEQKAMRKMKARLPFFWTKINTVDATKVPIWSQMNTEIPLDLEELQKHFSVASSAKKSLPLVPKRQSPTLLSLNRSQNLAIALLRIKMSVTDICEAIMTLQDSALSTDALKILVQFVPTAEEAHCRYRAPMATVLTRISQAELLRLYQGDVSKLSMADQYMNRARQIPRLRERLQCMIFRRRMELDMEELKPELLVLRAACAELQSDDKIRRFLGLVLQVGNALNAGTFRGNSRGFRLADLMKLKETRSVGIDPATPTLFHYLAKVMGQTSPDLLDLLADSPHVAAASRVSFESAQAQATSIFNSFAVLRSELGLAGSGLALQDQFTLVMTVTSLDDSLPRRN
ncbi:hypothetical protein OIV83_000404 [Microbotryomycetes sp. JL201]|nr:hypothetical protein OIV83_000404 [Microbotryomycetes sp. JL201]